MVLCQLIMVLDLGIVILNMSEQKMLQGISLH